MGEWKRYPKGDTRQLIDFNRFEALTGQKIFLCLDKGIMEILRFFLNSRAGWKSTYYTEQDDTGYTTPSNIQMDFLEEAIAEANVDMSTCDEINNSLQDIVSAISGLSGSGSGGCGCIGDPGSDVTDFNDVPSVDIPQSDDPLPPGFSTQEQYNTYRCDAAHWLYDRYTQTLRNWGALFGMVGGLTLAVITGVLLLSVPPAGLAVILSALGILAGIDIGLLATLNEIADEMDVNQDETICQLYNATTTQEAMTALQEAAQAAVVALDLGVLSATYELITANLVSREQCEVLFNNSDLEGVTGDCSGCGSALWTDGVLPNDATVISGSYDGPTVTLESAVNDIGGFNVQSLDLFAIPTDANNRLRLTDVVTAGSGNWKYRYSVGGVDQGETTGATWSDLETFDEECSYFILFSTDAGPGSPFTVTFNLEAA